MILMSHIHNKPGQHDQTASAFIIRTDGPEPRAILHIHKKLNKHLQFGGHVELDETPWQAIAHELREEAGYNLDQLYVLQPKERLKDAGDATLHPQPLTVNTHAFGNGLNHYHTDLGFAFVTDQDPQHEPGEGESTDVRLLTAAELRAIPQDGIPENVRRSFLFALEVCLAHWERVPATHFT